MDIIARDALAAQQTLRLRVEALRELVQNIRRLMNGAALDANGWEGLAGRLPGAQLPVTNSQSRVSSKSRDFGLSRTSFHDNSLTRTPSKRRSSLVSSAVAPISTSRHSLSSSRRMLDQTLQNHYSQTSWRAFRNDLELFSNNQFIAKHAASFNTQSITICYSSSFMSHWSG